MNVIQIRPKEPSAQPEEGDLVWFDWDLYHKMEAEDELRKSLLLVSPCERDIFTCVLAAHLEDIPQDFVMDPKFDGVLFVEKAQAIADGKFDVANLFVGIPADKIGPVEDRPAREEWEVDFQGYLVRKRPASNSNSSDSRDLDEDPYTRALRFLDQGLNKH